MKLGSKFRKFHDVSSKIKVLIISNMYPSKKNISFGSFVESHVEKLRKSKDVELYLAVNLNNKKGFFWLSYKYSILLIKSLCYSIFRKFDIIHVHFAFPTGFIGFISKLITRKKLIVSVHGGDINEVARRNRLNFRLCKFSLLKADFLITNSEDIKMKLVKDFDINREKIQVINMGVDVNLFKPIDKTYCRSKLGINRNKKIVLFVGNIIKIKGVIYLIDAIWLIVSKYCKDSNIECILLGDIVDKRYKVLVENKIAECRLNSVIRFVEPVPHDIIPLWMNASDVFVLPSLGEAFGLVALEALACGVPVIASDVGGLKEYIIDKETGFIVPPGNSKSLAQEILNILENKEKNIHNITMNGLRVSKLYDISNQIKKIENIYKELIN